MNFICDNLKEENNELYFGGIKVSELAQKYGTPLYVMDEERIRYNCGIYINAIKEAFGDKGSVMYASKAASFKKMYQIVGEEGLGIDVVSSGELFTAVSAGFDISKAYFHSNNKTDEDIEFGIKSGIGYFVVDNSEELNAINDIAKKHNKIQNILLRLTPGIDPHTYAAVATGKVDSKFGNAIETGDGLKITKEALTLANINLKGFHCHVGSQIFDSSVYLAASNVMLEFVSYIKKELGYITEVLDIGGGYGVRYVESDPVIDIHQNILEVGKFIKEKCLELNIDIPIIGFEPGRSIVADAGLTIYKVGSVKHIKGYKNYVSVDGGMTDNIRFALYGSQYTILCPNNLKEKGLVADVVGRCCESGDIIQKDVPLPKSIRKGDYLVTLTTGAYNYSMSSNYNRLTKPMIVMVNKGQSYVAVKKETLEHLIALDV